MQHQNQFSRRQFLATAAAVACASCASSQAKEEWPPKDLVWNGPIIDIHQHTNYHGRSNAALFHHQNKMGATHTIMLPAGSSVITDSTWKGKANGLYAGTGGNDSCMAIAKALPDKYSFMANEVPDLPSARNEIEKYLKLGAIGIGEQKFNLPCDGPDMANIYSIAQEFRVPVLMHFQYETFNTGFDKFGKILAKWPKVTFIGHAQCMWANIDANPVNAITNYPKGKVTRGGLTDKYLSDHPNFFADMSAGSGLNAMIRDEDHARWFIDRHQNQMMFGSDCNDLAGTGPTCTGASQIKAIQRFSANRKVAKKLLHENAAKLFGI